MIFSEQAYRRETKTLEKNLKNKDVELEKTLWHLGNELFQCEEYVKNPTMRWIFQIMEGISIVRFFKNNISDPVREIITNLNDLRKKIIYHFGNKACMMYGLIQENCL